MNSEFVWRGAKHILWGLNIVDERLTALIDEANRKRVLLVTTRSVVDHEALGRAVSAMLGARLVGTVSSIREHVPLDGLAEAVHQAKNLDVDTVIALGGGSAIDAAKLIVFSLGSGRDPLAEDFAIDAMKVVLTQRPLFIALPTTLSVAELAPSAGFTTIINPQKAGIVHSRLSPDFVLYDAGLARHTPLELWLSTGLRAVDHAVEALVADGEHAVSDATALAALPVLASALRATKKHPSEVLERHRAQTGAVLSYTMPLEAARGLSHSLGKRFGASFGIPHGVTSCVLLPRVVKIYEKRTSFAAAMTRAAATLSVSESLSAALFQLVADLGLPRTFSQQKLSASDIDKVVNEFRHPHASSEEIREICANVV